MPKGNILQQELPNGFMNVVSLQLLESRGTGQNPQAASTEEKPFVALSFELTSSQHVAHVFD